MNETLKRAAESDMEVPLLDLRAQYQQFKSEALEVIAEVCESQQFILGPRVRQLEAQVAHYAGAQHGIGLSSGTDALLIALMALDIGAGDEVITTPYTFFATAGVVARLGARPVFCDIRPQDFNINPQAVRAFLEQQCERRGERLVNRATGGHVRALIPVHLYGQMADMPALMAIAQEYGLSIIEDAAQAIGSELADGRRAGGIGDIGCFSFFPTKNLGAFGDAGMCVANDDALAGRLTILRVHGGEPKYYHSVVGGNFRIDELQAAVLLVKLPLLDDWTAGRQRNAAVYAQLFADAGLDDVVTLPVVTEGYRHIFNQFVIRTPRRDELRAYLGSHKVGTEIYYPVPLHQQECFAYLGHRREDFPESARAAEETLALPIYPELRPEQLVRVVALIARFFGR
jgi:dTDP-4-amino-4,6-dideoxygalactose transaminase